MRSKRTEFMNMFAKFVLSLMVAFAVFAETLDQKAYAYSNLSDAAQSGAHEIVCICDNCNQDEPDDSDIEEVLEFIEKTDDTVVRQTPRGQN